MSVSPRLMVEIARAHSPDTPLTPKQRSVLNLTMEDVVEMVAYQTHPSLCPKFVGNNFASMVECQRRCLENEGSNGQPLTSLLFCRFFSDFFFTFAKNCNERGG